MPKPDIAYTRPYQSSCLSKAVFTGSRGTPNQIAANIGGTAMQYCHVSQCHDRWSAYHPSSEAATFCDSSEFIA